jgi:hypothetical protein
MKTAMQELIEKVEHAISYNVEGGLVEKYTWTELFNDMELALEKEKKQIEVSFSDGQETPINHPTLPNYSREEYYNDKFILETRFQD